MCHERFIIPRQLLKLKIGVHLILSLNLKRKQNHGFFLSILRGLSGFHVIVMKYLHDTSYFSQRYPEYQRSNSRHWLVFVLFLERESLEL